jgi:hypothetical protein
VRELSLSFLTKKMKGLNLIRPPPLWIWIAVIAVIFIVYLDTLAPR